MPAAWSAAREWLLEPAAERRARELPEARRARADVLRRAAAERVRAAADIALPEPAIELLTGAVTELLHALRVLRGDPADEPAGAGAAADLAELLDGVPAEPWHAPVRRRLGAEANAEPHETPAELFATRVALEQAAYWLLRRVDARSTRAIRRDRWLRLAVLGLLVGAAVALVLARARARANVALGKPVSASSLQPGTPAGAELVDGKTSAGFAIHTRREKSPWVAVDLGRVVAVDRIEVDNRRDGRTDDVLPLQVELSADGVHFTPLAVAKTPFERWRIDGLGRPARHVRLISPRDRGVIVLDEVRVFPR